MDTVAKERDGRGHLVGRHVLHVDVASYPEGRRAQEREGTAHLEERRAAPMDAGAKEREGTAAPKKKIPLIFKHLCARSKKSSRDDRSERDRLGITYRGTSTRAPASQRGLGARPRRPPLEKQSWQRRRTTGRVGS